MKVTQLVSVVAIFVVSVLVNLVFAEVKIINPGGAFLPKSERVVIDPTNCTPAEIRTYSPEIQLDFREALTNWMKILQNDKSSMGQGRNFVTKVYHLGDYTKMVSSSGERVWLGTDDSKGPTVEIGNLFCQAVIITATDGDTFIPAEVSYEIESFARGKGGQYDSCLKSILFFGNLNRFQVVLNEKNVVTEKQDPKIPAVKFIYGGTGRGLTIFPPDGVSTPQQRISMAAAKNGMGQEYKLRYTVTVPYSTNGVPQKTPKKESWEVTGGNKNVL